MADLETQLRAYAPALSEGIAPVLAGEITESTTESSFVAPRRRALAVLALAVVAVLVVGATLWVTGRGSDVRIASGGHHPTSVPTTWTRVDTIGNAQVSAIASSAHGIVAVGIGIWFSTDGRTWGSVFDQAQLGGSPGGQQGIINDVTVGGPGFVAAGQAVDPTSGQAVAAIWTSTDGRRWTRVRDPALEPPTPPIPGGNSTPTRGTIRAIARGGPGLVAIGGVFGGTFEGRTLVNDPYDPAVWTSTDGLHWSRANTGTAFGSRSDATLLSLTTVFARGRSLTLTSTYQSTTSVFESQDGTRWHRVARVPGSFSQVTVYRGMLVAVGNDGGIYGSKERAVIWTSSDAKHWHRVLVSQPATFGVYSGVATNGRSLVAVGWTGRYEPTVDAILAVSSDARTWHSVPRNGTTFSARTALGPVRAVGSSYLVIGVDTSIGTGSPADPFRPRTVLFISN
jgi:hypothetical protein